MKRAFFGVVAGCLMSVAATGQQSVPELQSSLDSVLVDDPPIVLTEGVDFSAPAGTVIFLSRDEGMKRMVALARAGEPELSLLFLPSRQAWITETTQRMSDEDRLDSRYITAALVLGLEAELWHTHNDIGAVLADSEARFKRSLGWTMPSDTDFLQLYEFAREVPDAKFRGVIANIYGVTTYGNDDPEWARPVYLRFALRKEAEVLHREVGEQSVVGLSAFAVTHTGFMQLKFDAVP